MTEPRCRRCLDTRLVCEEHHQAPAAVAVPGHQPHGEGMRCPACCPVSFGAEISENRKHAAIVGAGRGEAGLVVVDLVWYDHPRGAARRLSELYGKHEPVEVIVDSKSQAATLLKPLAEAGILVTQPSTEDVAVAHGEFLDLVGDGLLQHLDQSPLTAAVRAAQQRPLAGAQAWERRVAVDQSPLVAATLACWAFRRWEELSRPGAWVI